MECASFSDYAPSTGTTLEEKVRDSGAPPATQPV